MHIRRGPEHASATRPLVNNYNPATLGCELMSIHPHVVEAQNKESKQYRYTYLPHIYLHPFNCGTIAPLSSLKTGHQIMPSRHTM